MNKPRILIVEDEHITAIYLKKTLQVRGYEVVGITGSGREAITLIEEHLPNLIIMDIMLEDDIDGIEVAAQIQSHLDIPILYLTASMDENNLQRAKQTGAYGYLIKPVKEYELYSSIETCLIKHNYEKQLRESENKYRSLFENMIEGFVYCKVIPDSSNKISDYEFIEANEAFENLIRLKRDEIIGKRVTTLFPGDESDWLYLNGREPNQGKKVKFDKYFNSLDKWYSIASYWQGEGYIVTMFEDITTRKKAEEKIQKLNEELEERVTKRTRELEIANNSLNETLKTIIEAKDQIVEAEKMACLGELVGGVAHEINTPLGIGITAASLLQDKTKWLLDLMFIKKMTRTDLIRYSETATDALSAILLNLKHADELLTNFKQVAVDQYTEARRKFNLKEYIEEVLLNLSYKYKRTKRVITLNCSPGLEINSFPGIYFQIISNLVMNSLIHAFEEREEGAITLDICVEEEKIRIEYSDDGTGMDEEKVKKIFHPFFTTKRNKGGMGLGMHIVYNLVTGKLGGQISCKSSRGKGTTFTMLIPISHDENIKVK
ncbi:MAG: response regulator [bacterium]|nr:response regulator [bacterium]